jgi:hypothetical protein
MKPAGFAIGCVICIAVVLVALLLHALANAVVLF